MHKENGAFLKGGRHGNLCMFKYIEEDMGARMLVQEAWSLISKSYCVRGRGSWSEVYTKLK